jgi:hypothetical protein
MNIYRQGTNVRRRQTNVRRQQTNGRAHTLMSIAPYPLDMVPIHFHKEVRKAQRVPRTGSIFATLAGTCLHLWGEWRIVALE